MARRRFVVMGAGEVGFYLARHLSQAGHEVVVIDPDPGRRLRVEEDLDASVVAGNGAHLPVLEQAEVGKAELLLAVSSNDEANMVASLLAKRLGVRRTVVRVKVAEDIIEHRRAYEDGFDVDLLLSTQLLTTIRILNKLRGHRTVAVEYLAGGKVQLRRFQLDAGSGLTRGALRDLGLPKGSLVVALQRGDRLEVPSGDDVAQPGDQALVLASSEVMPRMERLMAARTDEPSSVVIAGGGDTAVTLAQAMVGWGIEVKMLERRLARAEELAARFPAYRILHGDATDPAFLRSERIGRSDAFVAVTGQDESNLMASLLAQELGVQRVSALVDRSEALRLWTRFPGLHVFSPRALAYERIQEYIDSDYESDVVSLHEGGAVVVERRLVEASPVAGATLADINPPRGLIVGAVVRGRKVFVPRGPDRLEAGDTVIVFAREEELDTVRLLFPGRDA